MKKTLKAIGIAILILLFLCLITLISLGLFVFVCFYTWQCITIGALFVFVLMVLDIRKNI